MGSTNTTVGAIIARAWTDEPFKRRLLADPRGALAEIGFPIPADRELLVVENLPELVHLVLTAPRYTETRSPYSDIKEFGEAYRDPRLHPLNWGSHDPVFSRRLRADPHRFLQRLGIDCPDGLAIEVVENTRTSAHLVLPPVPNAADRAAGIVEMTAAGRCPPAMRYCALLGISSYQPLYEVA